MPMDPVTRKVSTMVPIPGKHKITVRLDFFPTPINIFFLSIHMF